MGALWNSQADKVFWTMMEKKSAMLMIFWTMTMTLLKVVVTTYKVVTVLETTHNYEVKESRKRAAGTLEDHHDHLIESKAPQSKGQEEESEEDKPQSETERKQHKKKSHADEERHDKKKKSKKKKHKHKDKS